MYRTSCPIFLQDDGKLLEGEVALECNSDNLGNKDYNPYMIWIEALHLVSSLQITILHLLVILPMLDDSNSASFLYVVRIIVSNII